MSQLRFASFLAPRMRPLYEAVARITGAELGMSTELIDGHTYDVFLEDIPDVSFICSLPYVEFERAGQSPAIPIAAPVLTGSRYGGRPVYYSDVIVGADSTYRDFSDLRGASWAYNERLSQSGYGITRHRLAKLGETTGFFSEVVEAGSHSRSMELVARGQVDAAAIDSQVLAVACRDDTRLGAQLRVVESLGPSTIQPVMASLRLPPEVRSRIADVITTLHSEPSVMAELDHAMVERFVPAAADSYDDIRAMVADCEAASFLTIR